MKKPRGDNQAKILAFIKSEVQTKGYPPSVREICDAVGLRSTSTVHGHLMRLEKKGLPRWKEMQWSQRQRSPLQEGDAQPTSSTTTG